MSAALTADEFYARYAAEAGHAEKMEQIRTWLTEVQQSGKPVVLVTSGGTTVPLEKNTVRFVDNFSGGNRGSASAEYFLAHGYAVLFVHRKNSLKPYSRHLLLAADLGDFLNYLVQQEDDSSAVVRVRDDVAPRVAELLALHQRAQRERSLLSVTFTSVFDYLWLLRDCALLLAPFGRRAVIYSAAAVSDFFLLPSNMSEHKIQSSGGGLTLQLDPVPKCLAHVAGAWSPDAYLITFKLETDASILEAKVARSFAAGQRMIVGNLLQSYKDHVLVYTAPPAEHSPPPSRVAKPPDGELELELVNVVVQHHRQFIQS